MARSGQYASDRWVTPGVVIAGILTAGMVVAVVAGGVTYLAARGIDPDPMLKLTAQLVGAVGSLGTLVLQLVSRTTVAKTERNTGVIAGVVDELAAKTPAAPKLPAEDPSRMRPPEPERRPAYVVDLDDDDDATGYVDDATGYAPAVAVPPLPPMPRHLLRRPQP